MSWLFLRRVRYSDFCGDPLSWPWPEPAPALDEAKIAPVLPVIFEWYNTLGKPAREAMSFADMHRLAKMLRDQEGLPS